MLYYEVTNHFAESNTKRIRRKYRGYGLRNVRLCAEKYGGGVETSKDEAKFKVIVRLNNISVL